ncbi:MAG: acetate/propionate family kinase [Planctomycetota bacterium]|nr:MAG: acetate/propionate family kinase [Planctomycetota bacterium]
MSHEILVINAGSSSIKVSLFDSGGNEGPVLKLNGKIDGIGTPHPHANAKNARQESILEQQWERNSGPQDHGAAMTFLVGRLMQGRSDWRPAGIGHRVVHGGTRHQAPVRIDAGVRAYLESLVPLAPLHEPANLQGIDAAGRAFPGVPQVACFDTAFHAGRPFVADAYALPRSYYDQGVRRYGFHGLSYEYIRRALRQIAPVLAAGRVIVCHLGNGASMCALRDGRCVETTMGFTAVDGLPMGTRTGQIDPGVLLYLLEEKNMTPAQVADLIYMQSGLLGLSGIGSDMRDLLASDSAAAKQAVDYFVYRVTYYAGALAAALGGLNGIVFTAGIGEHAAIIRERVCRNLAWLGLELDEAANATGGPRLAKAASKVSAWVVPTNEEQMIARHVGDLLKL